MKTIRQYIPPRKKYNIKKFNNFICFVCKKKKQVEDLEIDHKIPLASGGTNDYSNLFPVCIECHKNKTSNEWKEGIYFNKDFIASEDLNVQEKLKLLEEFLYENKDKEYNEVNFMVMNHPILSQFNYNTVILYKLYKKYALKEDYTKISEGNIKYKSQRDILLWRLRKEMNMTYQEMQNYLGELDFSINYSQIRNICVKFGDKAEKEKDIEVKDSEIVENQGNQELISQNLVESDEIETDLDEIIG